VAVGSEEEEAPEEVPAAEALEVEVVEVQVQEDRAAEVPQGEQVPAVVARAAKLGNG